jgi:glycosyltransferase involved in cell wall biosynthesis
MKDGSMNAVDISVIIPARNEQRLIRQTLEHVLAACRFLSDTTSSGHLIWEVLLVDNGSTDETANIVRELAESQVRVVQHHVAGAARARNAGRKHSHGRVLIFVDADTMIPRESLFRILEHCRQQQNVAGITSLGTLDGGIRARVWWGFWNTVRRLPFPRAKAMPAFMFCTAHTFDSFGPFDENVAIGEEWPILAGLYKECRSAVIYDRSIVARSSSRRMDRRVFGYTRCFLKYVWAILHRSGRIHYPDSIR